MSYQGEIYVGVSWLKFQSLPCDSLCRPKLLQEIHICNPMDVLCRFLSQRVKVCSLFCLPPVQIFRRDVPVFQGLIQDCLIICYNCQGLFVVVQKHCPKVAVLVFIPLLKVHFDEKTPSICCGIPCDTCNVVGRTENTFHSFEIFQTHAFNNARMISQLAGIVVCVAMIGIGAAPTFGCNPIRTQTTGSNCLLECASNVIAS